MQRIPCEWRSGWRERVESRGLLFHSMDGGTYWDEGAYYEFSNREIDEIEAATYELNRMCLVAVEYLIRHPEHISDAFQIDDWMVPVIRRSWDEDEVTIYGRFDLRYDGLGPPKLLEYNADTPTGLLEAAVIQWDWKEDVFGRLGSRGGAVVDQFNGIHERLIEAWRRAMAATPGYRGGGPEGRLHFAGLDREQAMEDFITISYLRDTAIQAGWDTAFLDIRELGWSPGDRTFRDASDGVIHNLFKLYPWEWIADEAFGANVGATANRVKWYEPPWKTLLSNKALLVLLYQLFPESPYLLPASFDLQQVGPSYVRKPQFGREGANTLLVDGGSVLAETAVGDYETDLFVYQGLAPLPDFGGNFPVVGSWMVNGHACGIGIRESDGLITGNQSRFVPHVSRDADDPRFGGTFG